MCVELLLITRHIQYLSLGQAHTLLEVGICYNEAQPITRAKDWLIRLIGGLDHHDGLEELLSMLQRGVGSFG